MVLENFSNLTRKKHRLSDICMQIRTRDFEEVSKMPLTGVWLCTRFVLIVKVACGYIYIPSFFSTFC